MSEPKVVQISWFDDHFYRVTTEENGEIKEVFIPSVTTKLNAINKPFLYNWYGDLGTREANLRKMERAERGSRIHLAWQVYTTGGAVVYQPEKRPVYTQQQILEIEEKYRNIVILYNQDEMWDICKLKQWVEIVKPVFTSSEQIIYSLELNDAGTMDNLLAIKDGAYFINGAKSLFLPAGEYILDLKTGNEVGNEAFMQVSRYRKLVQKMKIADPKGALIIHTGSKNKTGIEGLSTIYLDRDAMDKWDSDYELVAQLWHRQFGDRKPKVFDMPSLITLNNE